VDKPEKSPDNYLSLFGNFPIAFCKEDFSDVKKYLAQLRAQGITDLRKHFDVNPEDVKKCLAMIKRDYANQRFLDFFQIQTLREFEANLAHIYIDDSYNFMKEGFLCLEQGKSYFEGEGIYRNLKGEIKHAVARISPAPGHEKTFAEVLVFLLDITERKLAEEALRQSEQQYRGTLDAMGDLIHVVDSNLCLLLINRVLEKWLAKWDRDIHVIGKSVFIVFPFLSEDVQEEYERVFQTGKTLITEEANEVYGKIIHTETHKIPILTDGIVSRVITIIRDITERKEAEKELNASLEAKEILLRELHHRVKNNLQIIMDIFNMQADYLATDDPVRIMEECRERMQTIVMIHEMLYKEANPEEVDLSDFIHKLATDISQSLRKSSCHIHLKVTTEPVLVHVDKAIICGMILNALLSNALQHAFPDQRQGQVQIELKQTENQIYISIADNGVSFPKEIFLESPKTLGLRLVISLAQQLNATITLDTSRGAAFTIQIPQA
jgi:PAS domain S-box-containing protein